MNDTNSTDMITLTQPNMIYKMDDDFTIGLVNSTNLEFDGNPDIMLSLVEPISIKSLLGRIYPKYLFNYSSEGFKEAAPYESIDSNGKSFFTRSITLADALSQSSKVNRYGIIDSFNHLFSGFML